LDDLSANLARVGAQFAQHLRRVAVALAQQAEQQVPGADVVVA
jgi:hypothetical protein